MNQQRGACYHDRVRAPKHVVGQAADGGPHRTLSHDVAVVEHHQRALGTGHYERRGGHRVRIMQEDDVRPLAAGRGAGVAGQFRRQGGADRHAEQPPEISRADNCLSTGKRRIRLARPSFVVIGNQRGHVGHRREFGSNRGGDGFDSSRGGREIFSDLQDASHPSSLLVVAAYCRSEVRSAAGCEGSADPATEPSWTASSSCWLMASRIFRTLGVPAACRLR